MSIVTREEFSKIYKEQFFPILAPLEAERAEAKRNSSPFFVLLVIFSLITIVGFIIEKTMFIVVGLCVAIPCLIISAYFWGNISERLKKEIVPKIISLCGNMYMSDNRDIVTDSEIDEMGLFPRFTRKSDDDVIIGIHKGCNFAIEETSLTHTEGSGKSRHTVTDFQGLIIKIQMNKNFEGETIVGVKWQIDKRPGFEEVKLEDVEFMKHMKVYSTDQIEARYILTTTMIERLFMLGDAFSNGRMASTEKDAGNLNVAESVVKREPKKGIAAWFDYPSLVSAAFIAGYVYLFVPKYEDFFEVDVWNSLLDETKYYDIYCQMQLILSIIEYLKLDLKIGL